MSREVKYQAWDKEKKEMFQVERIDLDYETGKGVQSVHLIPNELKRWDDHPEVSICDVELREFTGLHDKNGTQIYEGDILEVETSLMKKEPRIMICHWVEDYGGFMFCSPDQEPKSKMFGGCLTLGSGNSHMYQRSIIKGNIYENPELLEDSE